MREHTDVAWILGLKSRDLETRTDLWELLFTYADSLAWRYDPDLVRDAALAAYQRILTRGAAQFQFRSSFKSYCKVIVANEIKRRYSPASHPGETAYNEENVTGKTEEEMVNSPSTTKAISDVLHPCLPRLTEQEHEVIEWLYLLEHTPQQVADQLQLTRNYVNVIAYRARKKLLDCLRERGFATADDCM